MSAPLSPGEGVGSPIGGIEPSQVPAWIRIATPSLRGIVRIVLIVVLCGIALYLAWRVRTIIRLALISVFLALAILPVVDTLDRHIRVPRAVIILGVYLFLFAAVTLIGSVLVPSMVKEISQLAHSAPRYARELRKDSLFRHYDNRYHITRKLVRDAARLPEELGHLVGPLKDVTVSAVSFIGQLITVLALTFLLILHGRTYVNLALALTGQREQRYRRLVTDATRAVARYTLGNLEISVLAILVTWAVLGLLGIPYALALAFVVGFFDLIPLVGASIGAIVVAFATISVNFPVATIVWIAFIIVWQRIEDYVVQPLVYGKALHVNPIVTILAVLCGAELLGILGALIAIPTAAAIQIVLSDWWSYRMRAPASDAVQ